MNGGEFLAIEGKCPIYSVLVLVRRKTEGNVELKYPSS